MDEEKISTDQNTKQTKRGIGCSCKSITLGGCLFIIIFVVLVILTIIQRPRFLWKPFVDWNNNGLVTYEFEPEDYSTEDIKKNIDSQINNLQESKVEISEKELTALARENFNGLRDLRLDIKEDTIIMYWILEDSIKDNPLLGVVKLKVQKGDEIVVEHIGTNRIGIPEIVSKAVIRSTLKLLRLGDKERSDELILEIINASNSFTINAIDLSEDKIVLTVNTNISFIR